MEHVIKSVSANDPKRCQFIIPGLGQCTHEAVELGGTCPAHGGARQLKGIEKANIKNYQLSKFQTQLNRHADSPRLKSLNDEVAILRMMLEEQLNQCQDATDLIMKSHLISDLVVKIEKLVRSCHTLESSLNGLLDKTAILTFATGVIEIITKYIEDDDIIQGISDDILSLLGSLKKDPE